MYIESYSVLSALAKFKTPTYLSVDLWPSKLKYILTRKYCKKTVRKLLRIDNELLQTGRGGARDIMCHLHVKEKSCVSLSVLCTEHPWKDTRSLGTLAASRERTWWPGARQKGHFCVHSVVPFELCAMCTQKLNKASLWKHSPPRRAL